MDVKTLKISELEALVGGLSNPSKMPGYGYSLPAKECKTGSKLRIVKGSTCSGCYAMKGRYVFPMVQNALYRRLDSIKNPIWVDAMSELILRRSKKTRYFRWHDSGDLQSLAHFEKIVTVANNTPDVIHWIPTREYRIVKDWITKHGKDAMPANLTVRLSAHMIGGVTPKHESPLTISTVSRDLADYPGAHHCPAPKQGNVCGDCRACWDATVPHVDYHLH